MAFAHPEHILQQFGITSGATVVDLGAGTGHYTIPTAQRVGEGGCVYAVDVRQDILSRLANTASDTHGLSNVEIVWGDIDEAGGTELRDGIADAVLITNVLFLLDDRETAAAEAYRILKRGGRALVVEWRESYGGMGPDASRVVSADRAREVFAAAGFAYTEEIDAGEHHYGFIFTKS